MALTKETVVDSIEVTELGCINVREVTRILEDGVQISRTYQRHALAPGDSLSAEDKRVVDIASTIWTKEVVDAYAAYIAIPKPKESGTIKLSTTPP
jgi:hypothetical protein